MRIYDISRRLVPGMATYPGEPGPVLTPLKQMAAGDPANVSHLALGVHTGTHVDAPVHFIPGGASVEALPLAALCGPARVVPIRDPRAVTVAELERLALAGDQRLLFQTRNGQLWDHPDFREDFVYIDPDAAAWLVARGVRLAGIDYLSVEAFGAAEPRTHRTLLAAGIVVVEGLDLRGVAPGQYELICLPLAVAWADGAPARAILVEREAEVQRGRS